MKKAAFLAFVVFLLIHQSASAWQWETHSTLAEKVCRDFNCSCISEIRDAAVIPDRDFKDNINHHCYNLSIPCKPSKYYSCPKKNSCPAIEKMEDWLSKSQNENGCNRSSRSCSKLSDTSCQKWKDIGIASHYFFDSKVFWHKVQGESYSDCHEPFEAAVEKKFESGDGSNWTIEQCGAEENYSNMVGYVKEFENILENSSASQKAQDTPLLPECGWRCKLRNWVRILGSYII
ncbi:Uncharacterised protein [uncultured archaeon]|nr:Uncharacterised protein [uncultured archaeon]